jgi:putative toxin-antitoxin system antitoxin component (TIGR02293 family)
MTGRGVDRNNGTAYDAIWQREDSVEYIASITRFLGGRSVFPSLPKSDREFIRLLRHGIPVAAVACAAKSLSMTEEATFAWLKIPKRTAARRKANNEPLRDVESERLLRLARLAATASDVLGTRDRAVDWMTKPNRALAGERPVELLDTDVGFQNALDVLNRIEHGVFS